MTRTVLVAGTASHVGKSTVVAGLCRHLADRGVDVVPFKAQNMSTNAQVVPTPTGEWGEIGVSQFAQATAARVTPTTDVNPVLLKPHGDGVSQLIVDGTAVDTLEAGEYYDSHWKAARNAAERAHSRLVDAHDLVIAEGAGSIAEINLHHRDLANIETARFADADIVLVADIERGGVFASIIGTLEVLPEDVRERVVGVVITKFRGDRSLLADGLRDLEDRTGIPVLGVVPHDDPSLPDEDSLSLTADQSRDILGDDDGISADQAVTVGVPRLPHIANFTDLDPLARRRGVRVAYLPLEDPLAVEGVVLPGTKNTVDDLLALRAAGMDDRLASFDGPVVGICGGYQLLGSAIENAHIEGSGSQQRLEAIGRLPVTTRFRDDKHVERVTVPVTGAGPIAGASGTASGYEIHMGRTTVEGSLPRPLGAGSVATEDTLGTYLHGCFDTHTVREAFVRALFATDGREPPTPTEEDSSPYDAAAKLLEPVDLAPILPTDV